MYLATLTSIHINCTESKILKLIIKTKYADIFVKSRNSVPIHCIYKFLYMSTFVSRHFAYLDMFLGPKQCFHTLI